MSDELSQIALSVPQVTRFDTMRQFHQHLLVIMGRAQRNLFMFDPDFSRWNLQEKQTAAILRQFLLSARYAHIQIATHNAKYLERACPHFLQLLREFGGAIECRETHKNIKHLSDSFCVADDVHVVRRFHCDHMRGAAEFDSKQNCAVPLERFLNIWDAADPCLGASTLGL